MSVLSSIQTIELFSSLLCVWSVWLNARPHIWGWPVGIVSVLLAGWVYFDSRLFAEAGLQVFYAVSGLYGWWQWSIKKETAFLRIRQAPVRALAAGLVFALLFGLGLSYVLRRYTQADLPLLDSLLTGFSLTAQVFLARKYLENWILWMAINLVSIGVYLYKELWFFMVLYLILLVLAAVGNRRWKKQCKENQPIFTQ